VTPPVQRSRRAVASFLSAAVALAALSAPAPASGQKPQAGDAAKKQGGARDTQKNKAKAAKGDKAAKGVKAAKGAKTAHAATGGHAVAQAAVAGSAAPAPAAVKPVEIALPVTRLTLANGLRVVLNVDRTSPTVAVAVVYDVGARNEEKGRSGFAHLFEHMMFQGSKNVKKGEHHKLVTGRGGTLDGTTSSDRTSYFEVLPSNELALGLWLEADRMRSLDVGQESFESQRKVVEEEHRSRVSSTAYVPSALRLEELVFQGYWPYEHPAIGAMADLDAAQLDWVKDFHARHYGPNNAVLSIAGDFDEADATKLVHTYFDEIPKIQVTPFTDSAVPEQTSQRTAVLKDEHAGSPAVLYGWGAPKMREPGAYALDLAAIVLGGGESSRLHQLLVRDKAVVQDVSARFAGRRGPSVFEIDAKLTPEAKTGDVEKLIDGVVKDLAATGPSAAEMAKAQRRAQSRLVFGLQTNGARARSLAEHELFFGDAGLLAGEAARYLAVTADDVKKAVAEHLAVTKRTVVETYPITEPAAEKKPRAAAQPAAAARPAPAAHDGATKKADPKKAPDPKKKAGSDKKKGADAKGNKKKKGAP
jgi:zinc protease